MQNVLYINEVIYTQRKVFKIKQKVLLAPKTPLKYEIIHNYSVTLLIHMRQQVTIY